MAEQGNNDLASEASMAELLRQLSDQTTLLARQEVALAKAELAEKGKRAGLGAGMFGGAGLAAAYAVERWLPRPSSAWPPPWTGGWRR